MGSKGLNLLYMKELVELPLHLEQSARAQLKWNWMFEKNLYAHCRMVCLWDLLSAYVNTSWSTF